VEVSIDHALTWSMARGDSEVGGRGLQLNSSATAVLLRASRKKAVETQSDPSQWQGGDNGSERTASWERFDKHACQDCGQLILDASGASSFVPDFKTWTSH
jgi:hypothetical protein